jgi:hypothetical protein
MEEIRCFKCGMPLGFASQNHLQISHYGKQKYHLKCNCGTKYIAELEIFRLLPGEMKNDWKE